jgi:hypothetical protein
MGEIKPSPAANAWAAKNPNQYRRFQGATPADVSAGRAYYTRHNAGISANNKISSMYITEGGKTGSEFTNNLGYSRQEETGKPTVQKFPNGQVIITETDGSERHLPPGIVRQ